MKTLYRTSIVRKNTNLNLSRDNLRIFPERKITKAYILG
jgi:hypothetical protein